MWERNVRQVCSLVLSEEDRPVCDEAVPFVLDECCQVCPFLLQHVPWNKGMGRREAGLALLRAEAVVHVYMYSCLHRLFRMQMNTSLRLKRNSVL